MDPFTTAPPHWLRTLATTRVPTNWIVAAPEYRLEKSEDMSDRFQLKLVRIVHQRLTRFGEQWSHRDMVESLTPETALANLLCDLSGREPTWIVGYHLSTMLSLIGWWRLLETGQVTGPSPKTVKSILSGRTDGHTDKQLSPCVLSDPPIIIGGKWLGKRFVATDWHNYSDASLHDLYLDHSPSMSTASHLHPANNRECRDAYFAVYWLSQCVVEWSSMLLRNDMGSWGPTASAVAWNVFRRQYLRPKSLLVHRDGQALAYERWAYCQSATLCNYIGAVGNMSDPSSWPLHFGQQGALHSPDGIVEIDVCSQYPHWLVNDKMPARLIGRHTSDSRLADTANCDDRVVMVHGVVSTELPYWPCRVDSDTHMPILGQDRDHVEDYAQIPGTVIYPQGTWEGVWIGRDVTAMIRRNTRLKCYQWWEYESEEIGWDWLNELHQLRQDASRCNDAVTARFIKILMNSLIGKFAQRTKRWQLCPHVVPDEAWCEWSSYCVETRQVERYRALAGIVSRAMQEEEHCDSMPAIPATVCAASRWQMHALRSMLHPQRWYYQGVDSIHCQSSEARRIVQDEAPWNNTPGMPRTIGRHSAALYLGKRCYCLGGRWHVAGQPAGQRWEDGPQLRGVAFDRARTLTGRPQDVGVYVREWLSQIRLVDIGGRVGEDGFVTPWEV